MAESFSSQSAGHPFGVMRRDKSGYIHAKANHHFHLTETGGAIEAQVNDPADRAGVEKIRGNLARIAQMFSEGNFPVPMRDPRRVAPGVPEMRRNRAAIRYDLEATDRGGRLLMTTADEQALRAIHEFLRFQIQDHRTGDSLQIQKVSSTASSAVHQVRR